MPRIARIAPKECVYHILTRGNNRQKVFKAKSDYQKYLKIVQRYKDKYRFKLYHYVLMSNHVHLVMETTEEGGSLAEIMKGINLSYVLFYKNKYGHAGHFWQDRYKSIPISKDNYLLACGSYVELNPVRAKIVDDPKDYNWSSYSVYAHAQVSVLIDEHPIYFDLSMDDSERRRKYRDFVKGMLRDRDSMKGEMEMKKIYGSEDFVECMKKSYQLEPKIRPRGRPASTRVPKK
jgi:putative transposase